MHWQRACNAATVTFLLVGAALAQSHGSNEYPLVAPCWQTCVKAQGTQCLSTDTDLSCLCQIASTSALQSTLQSCLEKSCDALNAKSAIRYLSHVYEKSRSPLPTSVAEEDLSSIIRETVTATGLTRAHRNMPRSMTSEPAATVTGITPTQVSGGSTVAGENGSSTISPSRSSGTGPKATQNGGTVLDQAGTAGADSMLQAGSLWSMSLALGCLVGLSWLW